jgi:hypothetical protein
MLSCTPINIGPLCNLYSAVDCGSISSCFLLLHIVEDFSRKSFCLFYFLTSGIEGRVRHIVFIHIVAAVAAGSLTS